MSDEKSKVTDKASEIAKNIWLAGVGAYGKAVDEAQSSLKKATEPPKLFRDLVKAGAQLEEEASEARAAARSSVEERIARVRDNFQQQRLVRIEDLDSLHRKVDALTRRVEELSAALEATGAARKKAPARKAATKKPAARKSATGKNQTRARAAAGKGKSTTRNRKAATRKA